MKLKINNVRISLRQEQTLEQAVCRKCGIPRDALGSVQIVRKAVDARKKNDICLNYHVLAEVETGGRQAKRLLADRDITQYQEQQQPTLELGNTAAERTASGYRCRSCGTFGSTAAGRTWL